MEPFVPFAVIMGVMALTFAVLVVRGAKAALSVPAPDDVAAPPEGAESSDSGLRWIVLEEGTGEARPSVRDTVTVHYTGWQTDGKCFDSSVVRDRPATFPLRNVIKGWQEGVALMTVGEKRRFWIPAELAYGERPRPGMPSGMLVFEVELLAIG